jgi:signal recognition particle subunit SRP54
LVKVVHDELVALMGPGESELARRSGGPTVIMLAGLQGTGKTTCAAKLAARLLKQNRRPLLVAADLQRPAAVEQLKVLGGQLDVPVFSESGFSPEEVCAHAVEFARRDDRDTVVLDTAGRLHVDEALMAELGRVREKTHPDEVLLVVDAMVGQDAVNSAKLFHEQLPLTGLILTKLDGDARGGAALSVRRIVGRPVKFVGVGEKLDQLESFHPERMATRILGMGDVVSLVEKAQAVMDQEQALQFQDKMLKDRLTLEDFQTQMRTLRKMGSFKDVLGMIPGFASLKNLDSSDEQFLMIDAIINSMTPAERQNPAVIGASRRRRIAAGCGRTETDVSRLLRDFETITKQLSGMMKAQKFMDKVMPAMGTRNGGRPLLSEEERKLLRKRRKLEKQNRRRGRRN